MKRDKRRVYITVTDEDARQIVRAGWKAYREWWLSWDFAVCCVLAVLMTAAITGVLVWYYFLR